MGGRKDLVLPKKVLRRISTDRRSRETEYAEINLKEWVQLGPPPDNDWSHFSKKGYECRACSSDQILGGVKDMLASLSSGRQFPSREARTLHRDFSRLHLRATKKLGHPPTRLAPSWARANRKLLQTKNSSYAKFWLGGQNQSDLDLHDLFQKRETSRVLRPKKTSQESRQI